MAGWQRARSCVPGEHLPPATVTSLLVEEKKTGRRRAVRQLETPVDEFGVPDTKALVLQLLDTMDVPYQWPALTNVHHAAWPRRSYEDDLEKEYRNGSSLLMDIPIQFHNLVHATTRSPDKPARDVIEQRVHEQRYMDIMFACGRRALRYARWGENLEHYVNEEADEAWIENTRGYYGHMARYEAGNFHRLLDKMPVGQVGLLPPQEALGQMGIVSATRYLGRYAAAEAFDYRRLVQQETLARAA